MPTIFSWRGDPRLPASATPPPLQDRRRRQHRQRQSEPLHRIGQVALGRQAIGQDLQVALIAQRQRRIQPQYLRRNAARRPRVRAITAVSMRVASQVEGNAVALIAGPSRRPLEGAASRPRNLRAGR